MAAWLQFYGALGYAMCVALAVMWASVGIAYYRSGRGVGIWTPFVVSMVSFAAFFVGLAFVALEASFIDRYWSSIINRSLALAAATAGWIYTFLTLRSEWRHNKEG